ncbi:MAG: hypothetical protein CL489_01850 [Acidobacteria bacterium]|nr:hypothetical protein [Acidobacteriota bacterium]
MILEDIANLRSLLNKLDERVEHVPEDASEVANLVLEMNLAKNDLGMVYDNLTNILGQLMESEPLIELRDGATIERKVASSRKAWQHKELAGAVMERLEHSAVDMDTGEILMSGPEMGLKMLDYLAPSYWRVGKLNEIGLTADLYCEASVPKTSVIVRKGEAQ